MSPRSRSPRLFGVIEGSGDRVLTPRPVHGASLRHAKVAAPAEYTNSMKVWLAHGEAAVVSIEDAACVTRHLWHLSNGYAVTNRPTVNGKRQPKLRMHHLILDAPAGATVSHLNGDRLDNRRSNLHMVIKGVGPATNRRRQLRLLPKEAP